MTRKIMTRDELAAHKADAHGRNFLRSGDGYDDMRLASHYGWHPIPSWGRDGWDLGDWPYVVISERDTPAGFELQQAVEGDHTTWRFPSEENRNAAVDYLFLWYAADKKWAPLTWDDRDALDTGEFTVDEKFRGPFSWERADAHN